MHVNMTDLAAISLLTSVIIGTQVHNSELSSDSLDTVSDDVTLPCQYEGPEWPQECQFGINVEVYNPGAHSNSTFASLEQAILAADAITPYGCVEIVEGQYSENVALTGINDVTIFGRGDNTIINGSMAFGDFSNLHLAKFSIDSAQGSNTSGIVLVGGSHAQIDRVRISNSRGTGLFVADSSDISIHHIVSRDSGQTIYGSGIAIYSSNSVNIECNTTHANHGQGIDIDSSSQIL